MKSLNTERREQKQTTYSDDTLADTDDNFLGTRGAHSKLVHDRKEAL